MADRYEELRKRGMITSLAKMPAQPEAQACVAHATAPLQAEVDALRTRLEDTVRDSTNEIEALRAERDALLGALEEVRSRSAMNAAMHPNPYELTARLGDIYQIADAALAQEGRND